MDYKELTDCEDVIDAAVEWFGKKWHRGMMRAEMRKWFPGVSINTMDAILKAAKAKIRKLYGIDPLEYKGSQISFYESILRSKKHKIESQIKAAERLDKLFALEQVSGVDPEVTARKIREALIEMDESVPSKPEEENGDGGSKHEGEGDNKLGEPPYDESNEPTNEKETQSTFDEGGEDGDLPDTLTPEMLKELRFNNDNIEG